MSHTNVKLTGQTLCHIQWNVVILTSVCIPLLVKNDSPEIATPFRITWPSEDHWGDVSYQCEAYWTNLASHTMKCTIDYLDIYECAEWYVYTIIRSRDKLLTEDSHTLPNHITLRRPLWWGLRPMWVHTTSYSLVLTPERQRVHNVFGFRH